MKAALVILVLVGIAASAAADYLWKRWMADRRQDRTAHDPHDSSRP